MSGTFQESSLTQHTESHGRPTASFVVGKREEGEGQQHTTTNSVTSPCVLCHVLNYTTTRLTLRGTYEVWYIHSMNMPAQLFPWWIPHHYAPLFCLPFSPLCTILLSFISPLPIFVLPAFFTTMHHLTLIYLTTTHLCFACLFHHYAPSYSHLSHHYAPYYSHLYIAPLHTFVLPAFLPSFIYRMPFYPHLYSAPLHTFVLPAFLPSFIYCMPFYPHLYIAPLHTFACLFTLIYISHHYTPTCYFPLSPLCTILHLCLACLCHPYAPFYCHLYMYIALLCSYFACHFHH